MLETKLLNSETPSFDGDIDLFLEINEFNGGGNKMVVGIENESGEVYRVIEVTGLGDFMVVIDYLISIGMIDLLADSSKAIGGYDARFSFNNGATNLH